MSIGIAIKRAGAAGAPGASALLHLPIGSPGAYR